MIHRYDAVWHYYSGEGYDFSTALEPPEPCGIFIPVAARNKAHARVRAVQLARKKKLRLDWSSPFHELKIYERRA